MSGDLKSIFHKESDVDKAPDLFSNPQLKKKTFLTSHHTLLAVPFLEKYVTKSQYHTVVGDHEDLKKDLKRKHK